MELIFFSSKVFLFQSLFLVTDVDLLNLRINFQVNSYSNEKDHFSQFNYLSLIYRIEIILLRNKIIFNLKPNNNEYSLYVLMEIQMGIMIMYFDAIIS